MITLKLTIIRALLNSLGLHEEAIESYNLAIKLKDDYIEAYNNKGVAK